MTTPAATARPFSDPNPPGEQAEAGARDRLATLLAVGAAPGTIAVMSVAAPLGHPEALLSLALDEPAAFWEPPGGPVMASVGAAHEIALDRSGRIDALLADAAALWRRLSIRTAGSSTGAPAPRLFGGLAFTVGGAGEEAWRAFGDGRFVLPRWRYVCDGGRAFLTVAARAEELAGASCRDRFLDEHRAILAALARGPELAARTTRASVDQLSRDRWNALVDGARSVIRDHRATKIVVARRAEVTADDPLDPVAVLTRLGVHAGCTRFAFRAGRSTFVGATPERLIARVGERVLTEALAGSIATLDSDAEALLASVKDGHEHALVVRAVVERLAPLCRELTVAEAPRVRTLRHLLHLQTPIAGLLAEPRHVLELVAALHPTPAVGGTPADSALAWIAAHEPAPRGWYAGPIGWFDAEGDGEFAVALRCGLLTGRRALVYAGSGIVAASRPDAEWTETAWKQRALLDALGIATP